MPEEPALQSAPATIQGNLAREIQEELGENVHLCYQCVKCSSGCPVAEFFDWQPNQIMRAVQLGQEDIALHAESIWLCAGCQTCTTRCPQGLDINAIIEYLTRAALQRGITPPEPMVNIFNEAFLREVRLWGRAYEPGLMVEMKLRNPKTMFEDLDLYTRMLQKMKVAFLPGLARRPKKASPRPGAADSVAYYPGCSLHSTAPEFNHSSQAVCAALGIQLIEPHGWQCCGSTAAHRLDPESATRLPLGNLTLIEQEGFREVTMPCAACFNRHQAALYEIRHDEGHRQELETALDYSYQDRVQVHTLIETISNHVGAKSIREQTVQPLEGLRLVCYYGCLLTRPPEVTGAEHPENPTDMDELLAAAGAEVLDWSYKTSCCGAAHSLTRPDIVIQLSGELVRQARLAGAEAIAVACPLCHMNLDARQFQMGLEEPVPVLYFTQLLAIALGLGPKASALHKNIVDPRPWLQSKDLIPQS